VSCLTLAPAILYYNNILYRHYRGVSGYPSNRRREKKKLPVLETSLLLCIPWPPPAYMVYRYIILYRVCVCAMTMIITQYYIVITIIITMLHSDGDRFCRRYRVYTHTLSQRRGFGFILCLQCLKMFTHTRTHTPKILNSRVRGKPWISLPRPEQFFIIFQHAHSAVSCYLWVRTCEI